MKVTVNMNKMGVQKLKQAQVIALKKTAEKMLSEKITQQEIPMNEGTLQNILTSVDDKAISKGLVQITSKGPYALRLYYNPQYDFNQEFNVNAKGEWWEDYLTGKNKARPLKLYAYFYKKSAGGFVE